MRQVGCVLAFYLVYSVLFFNASSEACSAAGVWNIEIWRLREKFRDKPRGPIRSPEPTYDTRTQDAKHLNGRLVSITWVVAWGVVQEMPSAECAHRAILSISIFPNIGI